MVYERSLMVRWIVGSIVYGGSIELFLVLSSAPRLVKQRLWDGAYKSTLAANQNKVAHVAAAGFYSRYLNGPLPYNLRIHTHPEWVSSLKKRKKGGQN